jgi:hypothetical protein
MGSFNKEKFESGFNPKKFELEKTQAAELRAFIENAKTAKTFGTSAFYDRRIEIKKKQFKDFIELAILSLVGSIPFKIKIDNEDKEAFEKILNELSTSYLELAKNSMKASLVSYGNTIDSVIVTESVKAYDKQLTAVKISTLQILPAKIADHNSGKFGSEVEIESGNRWKKYSVLIIIGIILVAVCVSVLYLVL